MAFPLSKTVLSGTVDQCAWILEKWAKCLKEDGVPGVDYQVTEEAKQKFFTEMVGELALTARQLDSIVDILTSPGV